MATVRILTTVTLALLCLCAAPATQPAFLAPDSFDFKALLGEPPADGSDTQRAEIETLLALQSQRTPEDVSRCGAEVEQSPYAFAGDIVGTGFVGKDHPVTHALLVQITIQTKVVSGAAKINWSRKRPYLADPRLKPCVTLENSFSYPSGHATRGIVWGTVLGEIFPEHRDALLKHGHDYGTDRSLAGVHYPSDVAAGQKLGAEIARRLLADPQTRAQLEKAAEECAAATATK